jgi:hypothetical protein
VPAEFFKAERLDGGLEFIIHGNLEIKVGSLFWC